MLAVHAAYEKKGVFNSRHAFPCTGFFPHLVTRFCKHINVKSTLHALLKQNQENQIFLAYYGTVGTFTLVKR
jgi:hypothetical protein